MLAAWPLRNAVTILTTHTQYYGNYTSIAHWIIEARLRLANEGPGLSSGLKDNRVSQLQ